MTRDIIRIKQALRLFLINGICIIVMIPVNAQNVLTIDSCYAMARRQYPLIKQHDLIEKTKEFNVSNAGKGYLPQLSFTGQATYQSAVTTIPITLPKSFGNLSIPTPSKDQYNIHGEIDQVIYDGGVIKNQKDIQRSSAEAQQKSLEVQLYALRDRINQVYFGALLIDEQIKQNELVQKDIQNSLDRVQASITNGVSLKSDADELQAELLQQKQNKVQLQASRKAYIDMLALFINKPLDENTQLQTPIALNVSDNISRPEISYYDIQKKNYDLQDKMLAANNMPRFSFFIQGGYAKPGLNAFDTKFEPYYIGGIKFNWSLGGFYTLKNNRQLFTISRQSLDIEKETFLFNTRLSLKQQNADIIKLQQMISIDNEIISKRAAVAESAKARADNGTLTVHDYIAQLNAKDQASQGLLLHKVQLLMAEYEFQNSSGN